MEINDLHATRSPAEGEQVGRGLSRRPTVRHDDQKVVALWHWGDRDVPLFREEVTISADDDDLVIVGDDAEAPSGACCTSRPSRMNSTSVA